MEKMMEKIIQNEKINPQNQTKENEEFRDDEHIFAVKETIVEEMAIDGICGVY
jgi:mycofactocin precursor